MKQRFSSLDIKVIAHELSQNLLTLRVANIYDLSSRIFLFKFAKPEHRQQLVVDVGFRAHLTSFSRTTETTPSPFIARLRKFLRTRRVTKIQQVGTDRILDFEFSDGQYHLFLEFYAGGNIVLTDRDLQVLAVQRVVTDGPEHEHVRVGSTYNLSQRQNFNGIPPLTADRVKQGLKSWVERQASFASTQQKKKKKQKEGDQMRKALAGAVTEYPPTLLDHALRKTGFDTSLLPETVLEDDELLQGIMKALEEAGNTLSNIMSQDVVKGYIIGKPSTHINADGQASEEPGSNTNVMYDDFHPFKPQQLIDDGSLSMLEFNGFNKAVDEFFSSIEGQKLEAKLAEKEEAARKKLEHAKLDQEKRIGGLQEIQTLNVRKAQAIEANVERVQEATAAINSLIAQGMDWVEIDRLIEIEQKRSNPVAEIIKLPLKLQENTATLLLGEWDTGEDADEGYLTGSEPSDSEDDETPAKPRRQPEATEEKRLAVDIDLSLSPWSNARDYYDQKRTAAVKEEKTVQASSKALRSAQQKIEADLKKSLKQEKATLRPTRQTFWFEKFVYFVSSDGYLVVGGKDPSQNELLLKRHMKKGDVYVHADLAGAVPLIIKNKPHTPDAPIPPTTLSQAGNLSVCTSTAWDSKAVMSAWWASADKITKTASTGDYLPPGKVAVRGDKLFLPPAQLLLGFAVLFQITPESKANHQKHRVHDPQDEAARRKAAEAAAAEAEEARNLNKAAEDADAAHAPEDNESQQSEGEESDADESSFSERDDDGRQDDEDDEGEGDGREEPAKYSNPLQTGGPNPSHSAAAQETTLGIDHSVDAPAEESGEESTDENEADADFIEEHPPQEQAAQAHSKDSSAAAEKPKQPPRARGKTGKKKKMARKYAEQDEEDREEAMRLLGSKAGQEKAEEERAAKAKAAEEAEAQRQRRKEQAQRKMAENKAREEERLRNLDEGDEEESAANYDVDLETLVGTPRPGDVIIDAIPVCAPWSALGRFKYKAKLQPGSVKKGKAVREILGRWSTAGSNKKIIDESGTDVEKVWPKEIDCIKGWKEGEVFNVLPVSKVRVMMSGGADGGSGKKAGFGKNKGGAKKAQRGQKKK